MGSSSLLVVASLPLGRKLWPITLRFGALLVLVASGGCGLLLDPSPPRMDAGLDASPTSSDAALDAPRADAPQPDAPGLDAARPDAAPVDAALPDAPGLDAPFPDAPPDPDASTTCACADPDPASCLAVRCDGASCIHYDDSSRCLDPRYPSCLGGVCYESRSTCIARPGICETFEVVGDICVRSDARTCSAGQACVAGRCVGGDCVDAAGVLRAAGFVCRGADANSCDEPDRCDGVSPDCPSLGRVRPAGATCGATPTTCRPPQRCDGVTRACPAPVIFDWDSADPGLVGDCQQASGVCLVDGRCMGGSSGVMCEGGARCIVGCSNGTVACSGGAGGAASCSPIPSSPAPEGTRCGPATEPRPCARAQVCGPSSVCRPAEPFPPGGLCRSSAGPCDAAEYCLGSLDCPPDERRTSAEVCRPAVGECDAAELCDGLTSACPRDALRPRAADCGAEGDCQHCDGTHPDCGILPDLGGYPGDACTTEAGIPGQCDALGACLSTAGGSCVVWGAPCAVGMMIAGICQPVAHASSGTVCRLGDGLCVLDAHCPDTSDPSDYSCPLSPLGSTCTRSCPEGAITAACASALCPAVCAAAVD